MQQLSKLNHRHQRIMALMLAGNYTQSQIAALTGFTQSGINIAINSDLFQQEYAKRLAKIHKSENIEVSGQIEIAQYAIASAAPRAALKLGELAENSNDQNIQLRASESILKMAFGRETNNTPLIGQVVVLDASKLAFLEKVAKEAGLIQGEAVERRADDNSRPTEATVVRAAG